MTVPSVCYPNPLRKGSRVFLAAPSSGVDGAACARLDLVIESLKARGLIVEGGNASVANTRTRALRPNSAHTS